jgi:hypothetical protein
MQAKRQQTFEGGYQVEAVAKLAQDKGLHLIRQQDAGQLMWALVTSPERPQPVIPRTPDIGEIVRHLESL